MEFTVIDKMTGKEADVERIALTEEWAKDLVYCDMEGFAITECGDLILLDECGRYVDVSPERFEVRFAERTCNLEPVIDNWASDCDRNSWECSECGESSYISNLCQKPNYCPYCRAKVVEEVDDAD